MNELVSIIMPSYNTGQYIADSIKSVQDQTYTNWELIIVDDCSTDNTVGIIESFKEPRIRLLHNKVNSGAAVARNYALREAKGKWIAFLDSDDIWESEKLEKQIRFMEENDYHFSYTNYAEVDSNGRRTGIKVTGPKRITNRGFYNYCWPGCLTVMYDSSKVGVIQISDIKKNNDYAMWLKVSKVVDCYLLDEELALYRRGRGGSISSSSFIELIKWHYRLFLYADNQNALCAVINTLGNIIFGMYKKIRFVRYR